MDKKVLLLLKENKDLEKIRKFRVTEKKKKKRNQMQISPINISRRNKERITFAE